jgi:cyanophycinase
MAESHAPGGTIALVGGGPFTDNDDLDRRLVAGRSGPVHVVPTADAYERPAEMVERAEAWGERIGVRVEAVMAMVRPDARRDDLAAQVAVGDMVWLVGDSPIHLRTVMKDTPLWSAIVEVLGRGGLVVGVAGSAAALCDPMTDPRGGAFTFGLGLVPGMAVITETETWAPEQLHRTHALAGESVTADLPTGSALIRHAEAGGVRWEMVGDAVVHGDLPR